MHTIDHKSIDLTPTKNGGECLLASVSVFDNGDFVGKSSQFTIVKFILNSYGASAEITVDEVDPKALRALASLLENINNE